MPRGVYERKPRKGKFAKKAKMAGTMMVSPSLPEKKKSSKIKEIKIKPPKGFKKFKPKKGTGIELAYLSYGELQQLQSEIEPALTRAKEREHAALREQIDTMLNGNGVSIGELYGKAIGKKRNHPVRYRDPDNANNTWSGLGRKPRWLEDAILNGEDKETYRIAS